MDMAGFIEIPWYESYVGMLYEPCRLARFARIGPLRPRMVLLPLLLLCGVAFGMRLWLYSEPAIVHEMLEAQAAEAASTQDLEAAESQMEAIALALRTPGVPLLMAGRMLLITIGSFVLLLLLLVCLVMTASGRWDRTAQFLEMAAAATSILALGIVVETLAMMLFRRMVPPLSPAALVRGYDATSILHHLAAKADLFTAWYLVVVGMSGARLVRMRGATALFLVIAGWMLLVLSAYIADIQFVIGAG